MFKRSASKPAPDSPEVEELKQLLAAARQEGQSLIALSDKLSDQTAHIKALAKDAAKIDTSIAQATSKVDALQTRFGKVEGLARRWPTRQLVKVLGTHPEGRQRRPSV